MTIKVLGPFLIGFFFYYEVLKSSVYILDNSSLSAVSFEHIFSQALACLLILLTLSFIQQKILILMKFSLPTRPFMDCAFQVSKKVIAIAKVI